MDTITIPKKLIKEKELVLVPRRRYEEFLELEKIIKKRLAEEKDTNAAIRIYKKEGKQGKLKTIKSLADLD